MNALGVLAGWAAFGLVMWALVRSGAIDYLSERSRKPRR